MKRYRVIELLLVVAVCSLPVGAQVRLTPGVLGGLSVYDESQSGNGATSTTGSAVGGVIGGILEFGLSDNVSFRTGLIYSVRGGSLGQGAAPGGPTFTETDYLGYLTVPFDFKIGYSASPQFAPYGLIGFNLGFLLSATGSVENDVPTSGNIDVGSNYAPADFGLDVGLGAEFPGGDVIPFVEVTGYIGFVNIYGGGSGYTQAGVSGTNTGVELRAGLRFKPDVIARIF
jgi:hypothetical protein